MSKTTFEQTLPFSLNLSKVDSKLLTAQKILKDFVHQYHHEEETFDLQKRHANMKLEMPNKIFFQ